MTLLEEGAFFLDNRAEVVLLECISDFLGCDRVGEGVVDEMGSLDSIIKLSSGDLVNNGLFVMIGELGGTASFAVFLVHIYFLLDSTNGRLPWTSFGLYLMQGIAIIKKGDDLRVLGRGCRLHVVVGRKEGG